MVSLVSFMVPFMAFIVVAAFVGLILYMKCKKPPSVIPTSVEQYVSYQPPKITEAMVDENEVEEFENLSKLVIALMAATNTNRITDAVDFALKNILGSNGDGHNKTPDVDGANRSKSNQEIFV